MIRVFPPRAAGAPDAIGGVVLRVGVMAGAALLAGCGGQAGDTSALNEEMAAIAEQRPPVPAKVFADRWRQMFANPQAVIAAANDLGFLVDAYAKAGDVYRADGTAQVAPRPGAPISIVSDFAAVGRDAKQIDSIVFVFDITRQGQVDERAERELLKIPRRFLRGFLQRFQLNPDDRLIAGVVAPKSVAFEDHGASIAVTETPVPGGSGAGSHHIVVTLTRAGAPVAAAPTPDLDSAEAPADKRAQGQTSSARK
jgi:hypothetical protein